MRSGLPKATQTAKLQSLPDDLRKIADDLLAEKFGVEEEVVEKSTASFQYDVRTDERSDARLNAIQFDTAYDIRRGRRFPDPIKVEVQPWDGRRTATVLVNAPSERHLVNALDHFDYEGIPSKERYFFMSHRFYDYVLRDPILQRSLVMRNTPFRYKEGIEEVIAEIYGVKVVLTSVTDRCLLVSRF